MNKSRIRKKGMLFAVYVALILGLGLSQAPGAWCASDTITWNISLWGGERDWTRPLHRWVEDMKTRTNGRWIIKLHYGAVLSPSKENLDGLKAGLFEGCQFCGSYAPGKTPLNRVFELPFILPQEPEKISMMMAALWEHPTILKELGRWNAVPLFPAAITQYGMMGNKRIAKCEDFKGIRIRIPGEMARVLTQFGAVPAMLPVADLYEAMERGTVDMATLPWPFSFGAFKIHEVSKYVITNFAPGSNSCAFLANKKAWDALPDEFKKMHMEWYKKAPKIWGEEYKKGERKWIPIYKEKLEFVKFPDSERAKLLNKAEGVHQDWIKKMKKRRLPGQEIYDYFLGKRKEICGF
ncbi:MAG: TRAP transporter substrate-binding protein DctP [Thermodesulfobacteriota bacterium]|nr:TRAP transporter substrate-binding protein DctP [Thermodesulfobacteriota bacterium]